MKPFDVNSSACFYLEFESNNKTSKFRVGNHEQSIFANQITQKKIFIKKIKVVVPELHVIENHSSEEIFDKLYEKYLQNTYQNKFRIVKVMKKKCSKLYVKCILRFYYKKISSRTR